jgi:hypothetical protein
VYGKTRLKRKNARSGRSSHAWSPEMTVLAFAERRSAELATARPYEVNSHVRTHSFVRAAAAAGRFLHSFFFEAGKKVKRRFVAEF